MRGMWSVVGEGRVQGVADEEENGPHFDYM